MIDVQEKKRKIIEFLKSNGPSLPIHVARIIQMEPIFASAILSELLGTKQIKTSNIRVGASPLYLLPGQEELLEAKTENLKSIERETQEKLKSKNLTRVMFLHFNKKLFYFSKTSKMASNRKD